MDKDGKSETECGRMVRAEAKEHRELIKSPTFRKAVKGTERKATTKR